MKPAPTSPTSKAPRLRAGLQDASPEKFAEATNIRLGKQRVSIMLDASVIEFFKAKGMAEPGIPAAVVDLVMDNEWSAARAWREHMELIQSDVARRMGITQGAHAQLEAKKTIRKSSREKIAKALGMHEAQLDF